MPAAPANNAASLPIYLDNAAATPMDERVLQAMIECLKQDGIFGNSASKDHVYGWQAAEAVEKARDEIATAIGCSPLELIFTSGATESNNLALRGLAYGLKEQGDQRRHIITTPIEHKAVLECCTQLSTEGFSVSYITPRLDGTVTPEMLDAELQAHPDTFLVSISQSNSVLGSMNDMDALATVAEKHGAYFHSDCAQSNGLFPLKLDHSKVSMVTLTPEKIYGPKGIGALYLKRDLKLPIHPMIVGGGHEKGLRGGTLATHQIVAMGTAFALIAKERKQVQQLQNNLRLKLLQGLQQIDGCVLNGYLLSDPHNSARPHLTATTPVDTLEQQTAHLPGVVSVSFRDINGALLLPSLRGLACSSGSACSSKELKPNYILTALGYPDELARASLRLSIGRFNTEEDVTRSLDIIAKAITALRGA